MIWFMVALFIIGSLIPDPPKDDRVEREAYRMAYETMSVLVDRVNGTRPRPPTPRPAAAPQAARGTRPTRSRRRSARGR